MRRQGREIAAQEFALWIWALVTSFTIATMAYGNADIDYVEKYFSALHNSISTSGEDLEHNTIATNSRNIVVTRWTLDDPEQANELRLNPVLAS